MIVQSRESDFVLIEQDHHAHIAAHILAQWKHVFFKDDTLYASILYAVANHDCGWRRFDLQPFWNDKSNTPYSFTDFPLLPKLTLYKQGIDEVEKQDAYAAALCSAHYTYFLSNNSHEEATDFLRREKERRRRITASIPDFDEKDFLRHLGFVQLADNLSLYLCLNDPKHPFFRNGIPLPNQSGRTDDAQVQPSWGREDTLRLDGLPAVPQFSVQLKQKVIPRDMINKDGLIASYEKTTYTDKQFHVHVNNG